MDSIDISGLTPVEKLRLMEEIWMGLRESIDGAEVPADHQEVLDARRQRAMSRGSLVQDWDAIRDL